MKLHRGLFSPKKDVKKTAPFLVDLKPGRNREEQRKLKDEEEGGGGRGGVFIEAKEISPWQEQERPEGMSQRRREEGEENSWKKKKNSRGWQKKAGLNGQDEEF